MDAGEGEENIYAEIEKWCGVELLHGVRKMRWIKMH